MPTDLPPDIPAVITATLRQAASWMAGHPDHELLLEVADRVQATSGNGACCPMCSELTCDDDCALSGIRMPGGASHAH
jgi:hypothetical protein